jgi:hypothetical protein
MGLKVEPRALLSKTELPLTAFALYLIRDIALTPGGPSTSQALCAIAVALATAGYAYSRATHKASRDSLLGQHAQREAHRERTQERKRHLNQTETP